MLTVILTALALLFLALGALRANAPVVDWTATGLFCFVLAAALGGVGF